MLQKMKSLGSMVLVALLAWGCESEKPADDDEGTGAGGSTGGSTTSQGAGGAGGAGGSGGAAPACAPGSKTGPVEGAVGELTPMNVNFNVRTPMGYDATVGHPLLVVYSPAGVTDPTQTEQFTGLTPDATARGYLVAYVNHRSPQQQAAIVDLGTVPGLVSARWCIDESRVYFTGHSDGGSVTTVLALLGTTPPPTAIAPSAAGVNESYLAAQTCPGPLPVMVIHSQNDGLFPPPAFGQAPADFWAGCSSCGAPGAPLADGCVPYGGCAMPSEVMYCQTTGQHGQWYGLNASMLDFFDRH
jgi:polyhydroxybutyrate depolymerase